MYFTGGVSSFRRRFDRLFPRYRDGEGVMKPEVPDAMVALVATAVRTLMYHASMILLTCEVGVLSHMRVAKRRKEHHRLHDRDIHRRV